LASLSRSPIALAQVAGLGRGGAHPLALQREDLRVHPGNLLDLGHILANDGLDLFNPLQVFGRLEGLQQKVDAGDRRLLLLVKLVHRLLRRVQ